MTVAFEGSADAVVKAAAAHEVRAIRTREDDLEEIFLRYYRSEGLGVTGRVLRWRCACGCVSTASAASG